MIEKNLEKSKKRPDFYTFYQTLLYDSYFDRKNNRQNQHITQNKKGAKTWV